MGHHTVRIHDITLAVITKRFQLQIAHTRRISILKTFTKLLACLMDLTDSLYFRNRQLHFSCTGEQLGRNSLLGVGTSSTHYSNRTLSACVADSANCEPIVEVLVSELSGSPPVASTTKPAHGPRQI